MRDNMTPCQHTLSDDLIYKEVVVIGNGPSGLVTSFMLAGNVPYLTHVPEDLPIDEMLRARLSNLPQGQSLYEADLTGLAEGLEGRSQNPIPLLMDSLLRPCADLGIQADSLIEWKFDIEKQVEHVVLGRSPPGGAWHSFPADVRTLSPAGWLSLPPLPQPHQPDRRISARAVAAYCRQYVHHCHLQRYFRSGVVVTGVTLLPATGPTCARAACPLNATFCVSGYDLWSQRAFRYVCRRVVAAAGAGGRPNSLPPPVATRALHSLQHVQRALTLLATHAHGPTSPGVAVVGSGVSAADAVRLAARARLPAAHIHRAPATALAKLSPTAYPDYCQIYKMMCDGQNGNYENYKSYPDHVIIDVTLEPEEPTLKLTLEDVEGNALQPKRVTLLDLVTNKTTTITVYLLAVLIGSKPDLFFLQTNFNLNSLDVKKCIKCIEDAKHAPNRKIDDDNQRQCFLKHHWHYIKSMVGQSIQSCKSRYLNYTEINGNTEAKCVDCNKPSCTCLDKIENGIKNDKDCRCEVIPYSNLDSKLKCTCEVNPYSSGIGFGIDPTKPVDGRGNPIAIDKTTHQMLNAPKGMYALGPLTADNFVRFIPGGALAIVASIHKEVKE